MPDSVFQSPSNVLTWSSYDNLWSNDIALPSGRTMLNGDKHVAITALRAWLAGNGGSRSVDLQLGSARTSIFIVGAASSAADTGWKGVQSWWLVEGAGDTARWQVNGIEAGTWFGRGGSGTTYAGNGTSSPALSWSGRLAGGFRYVQAPSAPTGVKAVINSSVLNRVDVSWIAPDDGDTPITGYRVYYWADGEAVRAHFKDFGTGTKGSIDLDPGATYNFQVCARNAVTNARSTVSAASSAVRLYVPAGGKVWTGSRWSPAKVRVWDGTAWKDAIIKVWNGTAWVQGK